VLVVRTNKGIRILLNCVANHYAGDRERIVEFSSPDGGGLISFWRNNGRLRVDIYRCDDTVDVVAPKGEPS
jgi:hypothetical protein